MWMRMARLMLNVAKQAQAKQKKTRPWPIGN
jgi:hypothetical protein